MKRQSIGQKNLSDAIQAAIAARTLNYPFPEQIEWTLADNTTAYLTQDQLIAFPLVAGLSRVNSIYAYARTLRNEIYKEDATLESVQVVVWAYTV